MGLVQGPIFNMERPSTDMASGVLICVACLLFIQSSSLRSSIDEIALSAPSSAGGTFERRCPAGHPGHLAALLVAGSWLPHISGRGGGLFTTPP
ncbi:hypothetical protein FJT64_013846 [Amphibalanus amphitrite]|uniref:Uncharacterized protein n=1 Tax=Amphibalanus amphitrite TaxID=1232801 RepID=A0A6A4VAS5_AMPAM|nr:hypothetical protein FJT64_013846 [Amphibalanus amphitrite]